MLEAVVVELLTQTLQQVLAAAAVVEMAEQ
jgi:hypothetical protein